jgi:DNA modification methylase
MDFNNLPCKDKIYFKDDSTVIYCADNKEILPYFEDKSFDLVLTDPPYGVGLEYDSYNDTRENWINIISVLIPHVKRISSMTIMPCSRIMELPYIYQNYPPDWLICWYKGSPGHCSFVGFNDWEPHLVYGKNKGIQMHDYFQTHTRPADNGHPCPKPDGWANYLISRASFEGNLILDPFLGSGTTCYCANKLNRKSIGIEISEKYCEIAKNRLAQYVMKL